MGTITIKNLIGGSINIITGGGSEPARHEKTWIWFDGQENYEEFDWSVEITQQTMIDAKLYNSDELAWTRNPVKFEIGTNITSIGYYAFNDCSSLTSITIPSSVTSIGQEAFNSCLNLKSITIPSSVTSIGDNAFHGCSSLTSITIPSSVTSIGQSAFENCSNLTSASILGFTQAEIRENSEVWQLKSGMSITASDGTFIL